MATAAARPNTEAGISKIIETRVNALRAKNADGIMSLYAQDNTMFILAPPLQYTKENSPGIKGVEDWFATFHGPLGYEIRDLKIALENQIGFSHNLCHLTGTKTTGEKVDIWYRETLCFRQIDGQWKIVHQHESVPFYMDGSGKAAVDLKP
jgi:ketosteroid isomerase-like protein